QDMGADLCIAVNVVPPLKKGVTTVMNRAYKQINRLNPLSYVGTREDLPNMFDIVMNSLQILQYELGNFKAISADVLINPGLSDFTWIEYYRSHELIDRGMEAAEKALPAIEKALKEKKMTLRDPVRRTGAPASHANLILDWNPTTISRYPCPRKPGECTRLPTGSEGN
ncbi:MAG: hypothetical protein P8Y94_15715, partial [Acidobacteriota bacterium]